MKKKSDFVSGRQEKFYRGGDIWIIFARTNVNILFGQREENNIPERWKWLFKGPGIIKNIFIGKIKVEMENNIILPKQGWYKNIQYTLH